MMPDGPPPRVLIAVPAWNEAATVGAVVKELKERVPDADVLVVDDGSTDPTAAEARLAGAKVIVLPFNVGVGGAMRTAFLHAHRADYDAVVQVDADGQHDPASVVDLVAGLSTASLVVGSRFARGSAYRVRGPRRWAMIMLAKVVSRVAHTRLSDTTSGFRAADRTAVRLFARHYPAEYLGDTIDSLVIAARAGLTIGEIPVVMRVRQGGRASHAPFKSTLYLARSVLALAVALTRNKNRYGDPE
jgi:glycosyltransferase involved in cell wall biosynthesis